MFSGLSEISIAVSSVLAVAVGSVWFSPLLFGLVRKSSYEGQNDTDKSLLTRTLGEVVLFFIFYSVLSQFIPLTKVGFTLIHIGLLLTLLTSIGIACLLIKERAWMRQVLVWTGYTAITIFGGLYVIAYWPW